MYTFILCLFIFQVIHFYYKYQFLTEEKSFRRKWFSNTDEKQGPKAQL